MQTALVYDATYTGHECWQSQLDLLRAAVLHLTPKEVLDKIDVAKSTLSEALHERNDKRWAAEWTHVIKAMLAKRYDDEVAQDLLRRLCEADVSSTPYAISDDQPMTAEEENLILRRELAKFGEPGKKAAANVGKGKRR